MLDESELGKKDSHRLYLVPTQAELKYLPEEARRRFDFRLCGFGPVAAGIATSQLLADGDYRHVILVGIAGTYDPTELPPGTATSFRSVSLDGIGAGEGTEFRSAAQLGFSDGLETLPLTSLPKNGPRLLTVCRAAGNQQQVADRRRRFPDALAEDMEAYAVALAATRFNCKTTVIRGISNVAGQRDPGKWRIREAMEAAIQLWGSAGRKTIEG